MKIYNFNKRAVLAIAVLVVLLIILLCVAIQVINSSTITMTNENYTAILKDCHDNPYKYLNKIITAEGYVFRAQDFSKTQFVTARDMLVSEDESRIVGFLCEYNNAQDFENNEWVQIEGRVTIGDYYGMMPIIKIMKMKKITTPNEPFVTFKSNINNEEK